MKYASFGSVSHGTMRTEDLLDTFASELEYHAKRNDTIAAYSRLIGEARETDAESKEAMDVVSDLFDALNDFAPPLAYFGTSEGDGSDYGYWLSSDALENFDGLKVSDTSEVPTDYDGEVLHVNDHGNVTLYLATQGNLKEVWAIV